MRKIAILAVVLVFGVACAAGQEDLFKPMKGSATPEFEASNDSGRCLVFGKNIVKITQSEDGGENVRLWHREGTAKGADACELRKKPYATINDSDNNSFYGISAVYFFIDQGTSSGGRTLVKAMACGKTGTAPLPCHRTPRAKEVFASGESHTD